jgi:hypothetical protein
MSQRFKLHKTDTAVLQDFAKVSHISTVFWSATHHFTQYDIVEQNIVIAAGMFKMQEQQEAMNPPDVLYIIPRKMAVRP